MIGKTLNGLERGLTWLTGKILNMPQDTPPTGTTGTLMVPGTSTPTAPLPGSNPSEGQWPPPPPGTTPTPPDTAPAWWGDVGAALQRLLAEFGNDPVGTQLAIRALKAIFVKQ